MTCRMSFRSLNGHFGQAFSRRTPLNFLALFFLLLFLTAMNSPDVVSRFVQDLAPAIFVLVWDRFFTAPLRALSPTGLLTAIFIAPFRLQLLTGTVETWLPSSSTMAMRRGCATGA